MDKSTRISSFESANKFLKIIFVLTLITFAFIWATVPKTNCDKCNFDGENFNEFMDSYSTRCLEDNSSVEDIYVNIDNITINDSGIWFPEEAVKFER